MGDKAKKYDLEERTFEFAKDIRKYCKLLPISIANTEDIKQLLRASGSIGANYIKANESISKKDFIYRIKICRKESKESRYFLKLLETDESSISEKKRSELIQEATELMKIFGSIISKSED